MTAISCKNGQNTGLQKEYKSEKNIRYFYKMLRYTPFCLCYKTENALLRGAFPPENFQKSEIFKKMCRTAAAARGEPTAKSQQIRQEKLRDTDKNTKIPV
ncbi:hypothetical protein [uncultured Agathobaculum sp.]|uniref:hypothetical protein n=1 Tax=uncultured Agathobaculum sp. TaxID=2048140 RepID=UPI00296E58D8